jgi:hypothetical protein
MPLLPNKVIGVISEGAGEGREGREGLEGPEGQRQQRRRRPINR